MGVINMIVSTIHESMRFLLHAFDFCLLFIFFLNVGCGQERLREKKRRGEGLESQHVEEKNFFEFCGKRQNEQLQPTWKFKRTSRCEAVRTDDWSNV